MLVWSRVISVPELYYNGLIEDTGGALARTLHIDSTEKFSSTKQIIISVSFPVTVDSSYIYLICYECL